MNEISVVGTYPQSATILDVLIVVGNLVYQWAGWSIQCQPHLNPSSTTN